MTRFELATNSLEG